MLAKSTAFLDSEEGWTIAHEAGDTIPIEDGSVS